MDSPFVEQFISSLAPSLEAGYPEFISRLNSSECKKKIDSLLNNRQDAQTASKGPLFRCLLLNFHRQASLAFQSTSALEKEVESLRVQNACLLQEVQTANKKAMRYLDNLHSAELDLCSHKEELFKLRSEHLSSPHSFSKCDSGHTGSHSSLNELLTPSPLRCEQFPTEPKFSGMKSAPQPPLRHRANSFLTSHLSDSDIEETCSLASRRYSATCSSQPLMHDTFIHAFPSKRGATTVQDCLAPASLPQRTVACDAPVHSSVSLAPPSLERTSQAPRLEVLESIANDIEHFDPDNCNLHVDDYLRELDHLLEDLPHATHREKAKLVWKTSSKAVHQFIQTLPSSVRDDYRELRQALTEEFSSTADEISALVAAVPVKHSRCENPREYYKRLRHAYFQGKNAPGLEENPTFKSLFLRNLHPCVRPHVVLGTHQGNSSLHEIRKLTQTAWETALSSTARGETTELASSPTIVSHKSSAPRGHPHNSRKGGDRRTQGDTERNRHVHQLRRDRHSQDRSFRRPYAEMAQTPDQITYGPDDDHSISDHRLEHGQSQSDSDSASECLSGYMERYSPEPQVKTTYRHKSSRARSPQW